jgi:hypothetical protein
MAATHDMTQPIVGRVTGHATSKCSDNQSLDESVSSLSCVLYGRSWCLFSVSADAAHVLNSYLPVPYLGYVASARWAFVV